MKSRKILMILMSLLVIAGLLAACGPGEEAAMDDKPYIPVISKGFQHAFWLAVEKGAEQAAEDYEVTITFEGPETEAMVDKQMDMLQAAIDKNPAAKKLFEVFRLSLSDINEQNTRMNEGEKSQKDIERHVDEWIAKNTENWNGWLAAARNAAK